MFPPCCSSRLFQFSLLSVSLLGNEALASFLLPVVCTLFVFGVTVITTLSHFAVLLTGALEIQDCDLCGSQLLERCFENTLN